MTRPGLLAVALVAAAFLAVLAGLPRLYVYLATDILIWGLAALSLNLLIGYTGLVSFGHAAYFGIGAYACGLLMKHAGLPVGLGLVAGAGAAAVAALVVGFFCVRLSHVYFSMLTLAFGQVFWAICFRWNEVTGGDQGVTGIPMPELAWIGWLPGLADASAAQRLLLLVTIVFAGAAWLLYRIVRSPFGVALAMVRQNPQRAEFLALPVKRIQLVAFVIAGAVAGLSGGLFGIFNRGLFPDFLLWTKGAELLIMVVLGGMNRFLGPLLGAAIILTLHQEITAYTEYWSLVLALILGILVLAAPDGVTGLLGRGIARLGRRAPRDTGRTVEGPATVPSAKATP